MTAIEDTVVAACADTMFPPAGPVPVSGTEAGLVAYVRGYVAGMAWTQRVLVRMMFLFIQLSPLLFGPRRRLFTRLSDDERNRALTAMAASANYFRRLVFLSMRAIMTMGYFACPRVIALIRTEGKEATP